MMILTSYSSNERDILSRHIPSIWDVEVVRYADVGLNASLVVVLVVVVVMRSVPVAVGVVVPSCTVVLEAADVVTGRVVTSGARDDVVM